MTTPPRSKPPTSQALIPSAIVDRATYRRFLELDIEAHNLDQWRWWYGITKPELLFQRMLRSTEYWQTKRGILRTVYYWKRLRLKRQSLRTGITISPGTFGPGLSIPHYGSVIVNSEARVGSFCRIFSGANIGSFDGGAPQIGDHSYIGPGAILYGPITVGNNVAVGANAVVNADVPDNMTVVGAKFRAIPRDPDRTVLPIWLAQYAGSSGLKDQDEGAAG